MKRFPLAALTAVVVLTGCSSKHEAAAPSPSPSPKVLTECERLHHTKRALENLERAAFVEGPIPVSDNPLLWDIFGWLDGGYAEPDLVEGPNGPSVSFPTDDPDWQVRQKIYSLDKQIKRQC